VNVSPSPDRCSTPIRPPWPSTVRFTIARPSPVPFGFAGVERLEEMGRGPPASRRCRCPSGTSAPYRSPVRRRASRDGLTDRATRRSHLSTRFTIA
jgi:hypothetical protein